MAHHKLNLPQKTCVICMKSFSWRKKWEKNWQHVIYCSERCSRSRAKQGTLEKP
ncbi:MAG TPA: DUF2256 domain-containing protein [Cellvibrio sp.]|nr:DUF2256 domain-containing protein [Cellvibrio sp.]